MNSKLVLSDVAEKRELERLRAELKELEARVAAREPELVKLQTEMRAFESRYLNVVGQRYDELAEIEKQIAAAQGLLPEDEHDNADSLAEDEVGCGQNRFHSDKLKKLYREVCRKFHPDLSADEQEREQRHHLMVEINRAYETGSEERLAALLAAGADFASEAVENATEMVLLTRRVAQMRERAAKLDDEVSEIESSELYRLKLRVEHAATLGVDLLADLLAQVERQIRKARNRLEHLQSVWLTA